MIAPAPVENCDPEEKDSRNFDQNMACSAFDMDNLAYEMKGNHLAENFVNDEKCFSMAVGYTMKLFFPADLAKTAEYYRIGCDNGSNMLCSYLASAYNKGEGVKKMPPWV